MFKRPCVHLLLVVLCLLVIFKGVQVEEQVTSNKSEAQNDQEENGAKDNWVENLTWNLLGYATIIVPAALLIRMIKNSNFNERTGTGCMFRTIQVCVFGTPEESPSVEDGGLKASPSSKEDSAVQPSFSQTAVRLLFCAAGLQVSYLTWGVLQERIMTKTYEERLPDGTVHPVKFTNSQFLVFTQHAFALPVAGIYILHTKQPPHRAPLYKYSYSSFSSIVSGWFQYEALKFVSFPTQVLCKASKVIPVMIMSKIVSNKTYPYYEHVVAVLVSAGISLFLLSADPSGNWQRSTAETTISGALMLLGYMVIDSFTSNWQSELFTTYKMSSMQMMFGTNLFCTIFTVWSMIVDQDLFSSLWFAFSHPEFGLHILLLSIVSSTGQLFIYYTIQSFGPVIFTIIMATRMMLSILLSCIIYNHSLLAQAIFSVLVVFAALFLRVYGRYYTQPDTKT